MANTSPLRIGVVNQSSPGWTAASTYTRMLLQSLGQSVTPEGADLYFLSSTDDLNDLAEQCNFKILQLDPVDTIPGERQIRRVLGLGAKSKPFRGEPRLRNLIGVNDRSDLFSVVARKRIDVLLPLLDVPPWSIAPKTIGWVPDFQHVNLPGFFSDAELHHRDKTICRLSEKATLVMLSSNAAREDFAAFMPKFLQKARVVPFPSLLAFNTFPGDPEATRKKFGLPEKFALVANQFWAHKNHVAVVRALEHLKATGLCPSIVMTGLPADNRDPANRNLSSLLQVIASAGLHAQIILLGLVPYPDLVDLIRMAAVVIQPSRSEGWSTIVQDAKALGRPLICSDIPVHREQAPAAMGFFHCDRPEALSELLAARWESLAPGPDRDLEGKSLAAEREFASLHGRSLLKMCAEAFGF